MTGHLSLAELNALTDTELTPEQLAIANHHLAGCPSCMASALSQSLLKSETARAAQRFAPSTQLRERMRSKDMVTEHAGFHVMAVRRDDLELIAVSDVEPSRLSDLVNTIRQSQIGTQGDVRRV
jgi:hypothetical protein